jgi:hypothetical protein
VRRSVIKIAAAPDIRSAQVRSGVIGVLIFNI